MLPYARPSEPQACQCKISQSTGIATQCNTGFYGHPEFLEQERERKKQSQIRLNFKSLLTWLTETEKELKRLIENKEDEFLWKKNSKIGGEKMRNISGQQVENEQQ